MKKISLIVVFLVVLMSCTKSVKSEFHEAVQKNEKSKTQLEWDSAEENPRKLFERLRGELSSKSGLPQEVCEALSSLRGKDLSLFEEEVNREENLDLLKGCRESVKKKIEDYWGEQKKALESTVQKPLGQ